MAIAIAAEKAMTTMEASNQGTPKALRKRKGAAQPEAAVPVPVVPVLSILAEQADRAMPGADDLKRAHDALKELFDATWAESIHHHNGDRDCDHGDLTHANYEAAGQRLMAAMAACGLEPFYGQKWREDRDALYHAKTKVLPDATVESVVADPCTHHCTWRVRSGHRQYLCKQGDCVVVFSRRNRRTGVAYDVKRRLKDWLLCERIDATIFHATRGASLQSP